MKKISIFLLLFVFMITMASCNDNQTDDNPSNNNAPAFELINHTEADSPYRQEVSEGGKARIVNRKAAPHLVVSTLLRTDLLINGDFLEPEDMEDYFAIAKANSNAVAGPLLVIIFSLITTLSFK
jgi:hypothetical protein